MVCASLGLPKAVNESLCPARCSIALVCGVSVCGVCVHVHTFRPEEEILFAIPEVTGCRAKSSWHFYICLSVCLFMREHTCGGQRTRSQFSPITWAPTVNSGCHLCLSVCLCMSICLYFSNLSYGKQSKHF